MTSTIDPNTIGKPARARRHVRTLTGKFFSPIVVTSGSGFGAHDANVRVIGRVYDLQVTSRRKTRPGKKNGPGEKRLCGRRACDLSTPVCGLLSHCVVLRSSFLGIDVEQITKSFVNHVQTSLARQPYNLGMVYAFV